MVDRQTGGTVRPEVRGTADAKIAAATLELLRTKGPAAVTIDGVAGRSGVARTTIYRRFSDRDEMLAAALLAVGVPDPEGVGESDAERLRWVIENAGGLIFDGIGLGGIAALVTGVDPQFTEVFRRILRVHLAALTALLARDHERTADERFVGMLVDAVVGALVAEHARTGAIADGWVDRLLGFFTPVFHAHMTGGSR
ncbi:TetR/AcrR family transcriptional regulator [Gordonia sp. NPDC003376]